MEIYLDYIFLENMIVNFFIIFETVKLTKTKVSKITEGIVCILDTVLSCFLYIHPQFPLQIVCTLVFAFILFKPKNLISLVKHLILYYFVYFIYLGIIIFLGIVTKVDLNVFILKMCIYIISGLILHVVCKFIWKIFKTKINEDNLMYVLKIEGVNIPVFVDTGNSVKASNRHLNVVFLDKGLESRLCKSNANKQVNFACETIAGLAYKKAYEFENVDVFKNDEYVNSVDKMIVSFDLNNHNEEYSGIVGYDMYLEDFKGVNL